MAVSNCSRTCRQCGSEFVRTAKGQPTKYCSSECLDAGSSRVRAAWYAARSPRRVCQYCRAAFCSTKQIKWCSIACRTAAHRASLKPPRRRNPADYFNCEQCGDRFYRKRSAVRRAIGKRYLFCSDECRSLRRKVRIEIDHLRQIALKAHIRLPIWGNCASCSKAIIADRQHCAACKAKASVRSGCCAVCGSAFVRTVRWQRSCSDACRLHALKATRKRARNSASGVASRRADKKKRKALRRARQAIRAESIDPIAVFERDSWRCHLCGRHTPRNLRGTYDDEAPELDHLITLAEGGSHTWDNVACACRRCNGLKGSKSTPKAMAA